MNYIYTGYVSSRVDVKGLNILHVSTIHHLGVLCKIEIKVYMQDNYLLKWCLTKSQFLFAPLFMAQRPGLQLSNEIKMHV